jgi:type IV pilus assembly protein PilV
MLIAQPNLITSAQTLPEHLALADLARDEASKKSLILKKSNSHHLQKKKYRGFSLIEVLVSVLLIALGLSSMAAMIGYSINANANSVNRVLATMLANEYSEIVRSNPDQMDQPTPIYVRVASYANFGDDAHRNVPGYNSTLCAYPTCTTDNLATKDSADFLRRLKATLPGGDYTFSAVSSRQFDLWIFWQESRGVVNSGDDERNSDNCPQVVRNLADDVRPRCLYMRVAI